MGALTGNTVQSTYLDLVQLGKSGAGLPAHAGKEAAIYDGSGAQIIGRTARKSWLDPDSNAIALAAGIASEECLVDKDAAALAAIGWVKDANSAISIQRGWFRLRSTGSDTDWKSAYVPVTLSGDFDIWMAPFDGSPEYGPSAMQIVYLGVCDSTAGGGAGVVHVVGRRETQQTQHTYTGSTIANPEAGSTANATRYGGSDIIFRIFRVSGTVYLLSSGFGDIAADVNKVRTSGGNRYLWAVAATVSDSSTFDRVYLYGRDSLSGAVTPQCGFRFLRRYA